MTEDEASTKWCPQAGLEKSLRLHTMSMLGIAKPDSKSILNDIIEVANNKDHKCIASDCAMWVTECIVGTDKTTPALPVGGHCGLIK